MGNFTDRFINVQIQVYNTKEKDLTGKENCVDTDFKFNPFELSHYYKSFDDETEKEITQIQLKNGYSVAILLTVNEFEDLLNKTN